MNEKQPTLTKTFRAQWAVMTFYERFEQVIALVLSAVIAVSSWCRCSSSCPLSSAADPRRVQSA